MTESHQEDSKESKFSLDELKLIEAQFMLLHMEDGPDINESLDVDLPTPQQEHATAILTLIRIYFEVEEGIEEAKEEVEEILEPINEEFEIGQEMSDAAKEARMIRKTAANAFQFFLLISNWIEKQSVQILENELIIDEFSNTKKTSNLLNRRFNQEDREDLLLRSGAIDEALKSEMSHVRSVRNRLAHNYIEHIFLEGAEKVLKDMRRAMKVHNELIDLSTEENVVPIEVFKE